MLTVLFGSGADSCYSPELKSGASFSKALLRDSFFAIRKELYGEEMGKFKLVYPGSKNVFLKTIVTHKEKAIGVFGEELVKKCEDYYNSKNKDIKDVIEAKCKEWYTAIMMESNDIGYEVKFFLELAVFFDVLDEKFNSLREWPLNSNAKRVISAYCTVFFLMLNSLYRMPDDFLWNFENIMDLLNKPYDICATSEDSYYHILRDSSIAANIVTTNYTNIAEQVVGSHVIYLHGNLTWFEDYKNLTVYDCKIPSERYKALENSKTILPFILIPSGVKPIICKKQLNQFHAFIDCLGKSNWLCSVGYRFNSEDNHINSIIADWLREGEKRLICFSYNHNIDFSKLEMFVPFKLTEQDYVPGMFSMLHMDDGILSVNVSENNSRQAFEEFLSIINKLEEN